jgi:hypothetical protein
VVLTSGVMLHLRCPVPHPLRWDPLVWCRVSPAFGVRNPTYFSFRWPTLWVGFFFAGPPLRGGVHRAAPQKGADETSAAHIVNRQFSVIARPPGSGRGDLSCRTLAAHYVQRDCRASLAMTGGSYRDKTIGVGFHPPPTCGIRPTLSTLT